MGPKKNAVKRSNAKAKTNSKPKPKPKKPKKRSKSQEKKKRVEKTNKIAKQHKQKLLNAKRERQRHRNVQMRRNRRRLQAKQTKQKAKMEKDQTEGKTKAKDLAEEDDIMLTTQFLKEDSYFRRLLLYIEDCLAGLLYFLTVTIHSERTFDWLVFLANNLGLYQEYEINDHGQRLSPRTGRPVLLSLGPLRVVQIVESANQVRSHWDPYIRDYLRSSNLTTDCWRANRMALQVALCMDDTGTMYDMPLDKEDNDE